VLRTNCAKCLDGQAPKYGVCLLNCNRVQRTWNAVTFRFDVSCCTCNAGYYFAADKTCKKCPEGCASCTLDSAAVKCLACSQLYYLAGGTTCTSCTKLADDGSCTYDITQATAAVAPATTATCICASCTPQGTEKTNQRYLDTAAKVCKAKTAITNCAVYEAGSASGC